MDRSRNEKVVHNPGTKSSGSGTWPNSSRRPPSWPPWGSGRSCTTCDNASSVTLDVSHSIWHRFCVNGDLPAELPMRLIAMDIIMLITTGKNAAIDLVDSKFASSWNRRRLVKAAVCCMPELHEENVATKLCNETAKRRYRDFVSRRTMFKAFKTCACTVGEVRRVEKGPLVQALFYAPRLPHTDWSPCWIPVCQEFFISLIFMA